MWGLLRLIPRLIGEAGHGIKALRVDGFRA